MPKQRSAPDEVEQHFFHNAIRRNMSSCLLCCGMFQQACTQAGAALIRSRPPPPHTHTYIRVHDHSFFLQCAFWDYVCFVVASQDDAPNTTCSLPEKMQSSGFIMYDVMTVGIYVSVVAAALLYTRLQGDGAEVGKFRTASGRSRWFSWYLVKFWGRDQPALDFCHVPAAPLNYLTMFGMPSLTRTPTSDQRCAVLRCRTNIALSHGTVQNAQACNCVI